MDRNKPTSVVLESVPLDEEGDRRPSMNSVWAAVTRHMGKTTGPFVVRTHPDTFGSWFPNVTGALMPMSNAAHKAVNYRCNLDQERNALEIADGFAENDFVCTS